MYWTARLLQILGVNSIPAFGYFGAGWSPGTTLIVYWFENLLGSLFVAARIALHRRMTHKRGHYRAMVTKTIKARSGVGQSVTTVALSTFLSYFLTTSIIFTLAPSRNGNRTRHHDGWVC